jgi:hypothetical protein
VVWFGLRSFWGHLRHFIASAIATEDVDSRDWMTPNDPYELVNRITSTLNETPAPDGTPLVEALGRDLWIDYLADTGDDATVSRAVAKLVFADYELLDGQGQVVFAPRGDLLVFGGDTAYPVATAREITNRVLVPFNQELENKSDGRARVILGIPGNHDWYDGLDGFARMFRHRSEEAGDDARPSTIGMSERMLEHYAEWARQFVKGGQIEKPESLVLSGYTPVQSASYFVLPLTRTLHLVGVDRQLKRLDGRQRLFVSAWLRRHPEICPWIVLPDPVYHFGDPSGTGTDMVRALELDLEAKPHFLLSGDVHHYERFKQGKTLHVVAGGGGAFLHPARLGGRPRMKPDVQWPDVRQCMALLRQVPWKIGRGRSGFIPHLVLSALFLPSMLLSTGQNPQNLLVLFGVTALATTIAYALIGNVRRRGTRVLAPALVAAMVTVLVPVACAHALSAKLLPDIGLPSGVTVAVLMALSACWGAFIFGAYLAFLTARGLEHTQAFTALDHPGFKHFLRLRVGADGRVQAWCLGLEDPLATDARPVSVDYVEFPGDE